MAQDTAKLLAIALIALGAVLCTAGSTFLSGLCDL
jgi:hypothetical protein